MNQFQVRREYETLAVFNEIQIKPKGLTRNGRTIDAIVLGKDCQVWIIEPDGALTIVNVLLTIKPKG